MAKDLPQSDDPERNTSVGIAEILLVLPDGKEVSVRECFDMGRK
jgi:hypothetical protein